VTIGGILGMAAHLEGRGVGVLDMAGLAQGRRFQLRASPRSRDIHAIRSRLARRSDYWRDIV
jgi:indolepyruvate ferredoxin oxidoreductase